MKKFFWTMICGLAVMTAAEQGIAGTITMNEGAENETIYAVGIVDTLMRGTFLKNSSEASETSWVNSVLSTPVPYIYKIDELDKADWYTVNGEGVGVFALNLGVYEPGYFLVKTGDIKPSTTTSTTSTNPTPDFDHFLYQNNDSLGWAVIRLEDMGITDIKNIEKISHVTMFSPAPEPAILTLLATGVAGLAGVRRRRKK